MKSLFILSGICYLFISCDFESKLNNSAKENKPDSLMKKYVGETFDLHGKYWDKDFSFYLDLKKNDLYGRDLILFPGNYKLQYFDFGDGQFYRPFAVRVSRDADSFLAHFSFADEVYYMNNSNDIFYLRTAEKDKLQKRIDYDSVLTKKVNLEKKLNRLIRELGYQRDEQAIRNLIFTLFSDLLRMDLLNYCEQERIEKVFIEGKKDESIKDQCNAELEILNLTSDWFLKFTPKEGVDGYWAMKIEGNDGEYEVKVRFVGDLTYSCFYI